MNQVIKVSINRVAFTLTQEAYNVLKVYLDHLSRYYSAQQGGKEVMEGIEERIAELLAERCHTGADVVSKANVDEVLAILGTPEIIEEEGTGFEAGSGQAQDKSYTYTDEPRPIKKLYRDLDHRVIGGVCSGLAAFWKFDKVLLRIIFIAFTLCAGVFIHWEDFEWTAFWAILLYIILWISIPGARTVEERCAMRGESMSARGVEDRVFSGNSRRHRSTRTAGTDTASAEIPAEPYSPRPSVMSRILKGFLRICAFILGGFFLVGATIALICLVAVICGFSWTFSAALPGLLIDLLPFAGGTWLLKLFCALVIFIPIVGLLYLGCKLVFRLRGHKWLGLGLFLLWLASAIGVVIIATNIAKDFRRKGEFTETVALALPSDTLYVDMHTPNGMPDEHYYLQTSSEHYNLGWIEGNRKNFSFTCFPSLNVQRNDSEESNTIHVHAYNFAKNRQMADVAASLNRPAYTISGNVLTIEPMSINKKETWKGNYSEITLNVPDSTVVIVKKPVPHEFGKTPRRSVDLIDDNFPFFN